MAVIVKIMLSKPLVERKGSWRLLMVLVEELLQEDKSLSLIKVSTSIDVILEPDFVNLLQNVIIQWIINKVFEKSSHFFFRDNTISVHIMVIEELVETGHGWGWKVVLLHEVFKELMGLNLVEVAAVVNIIVEPNFVHLISDELIRLNLCSSKFISGGIQVISDKSSHL
jgi:hypothetical protein